MSEQEGKPEIHRNDKYLIELIINQDHIAATYVKILLTIEGALVLAFAGVASLLPGQEVPSDNYTCPHRLHAYISIGFAYVIPLLGVLATILFTAIIIYERKWQTWYVQKFNDVEDNSDKVFPRDRGVPNAKPAEQPLSKEDKSLCCVATLVTLAWLLAWMVVVYVGDWKHQII